MPDLPSGTVTFLFTDIEGSTHLLQQLGQERYAALLAEHHGLLRAAFQAHDGREIDTQGDAFFVTFGRATDAGAAVVAVQRALAAHTWPEGAVHVRMGLHTGEPILTTGGYVGLDVHRAARICSAGHGGQILLSQTTRILVEHELPEGVSLRDLGEHRLKDLARPEHIFQLVIPDLPADFPPLKSLDTLPNNLPIQLTSFIGREREMAEIKRLLTTTRLLTLTGGGGCGKTRLALQVAADLLEEYADGVWLAELAVLADPALVPQAVASALSVREAPGRPLLATLADYLQLKQLLLVLDNCEHLVRASAQLADSLLHACPNLRILASSREGLGIAGELAYHVPSLSLPDPNVSLPLKELTQYEAVRLFIERAVFSQPQFAVTANNAPAVLQICQRLDGIPLAIELATARVKVLSVEQIAQRLDDRFRLLTGGSRTALPRQQTLRAAIDWSFNLLAQAEQTLLCTLSVFAGGCVLEAAEGICADDLTPSSSPIRSGVAVGQGEVLDLLTHLVDKSLVMVKEQGGVARYMLLETVRQYSRDRLLESGEVEGLRRRHRDWFLALVERAEVELTGAEQERWLERLETEHDNLRAALEWSKTEQGGAEAGLRLAGALWRFWEVRGHWSEGRRWLEEMLTGDGGASTPLRAKALHGAGFLAVCQGEYAAARPLFEEGLAISQKLGDRRGLASSLSDLGLLAHRQGDYPTARSLYEQSLMIRRALGHKPDIALSLHDLGLLAHIHGDYATGRSFLEEGLAISRELEDKRGIASSLNNLGLLAHRQGDYPTARALYEETLAICRELRDKRGIAYSLNNLGLMASHQQDYTRAHSLLEESLGLKRELGDKRGSAASLQNLGMVATYQQDYAAARSLYQESLILQRELSDKEGAAECMEGLAKVAEGQGELERAARLSGAAEALRETIGAPVPPVDRADYERTVAAARAALGAEAFAAAWTQGRAMTVGQAIEYALEKKAVNT